MKQLKRLFSIIISTTMVMSMLAVNVFAAPTFSDTTGHWAQSAIEDLAAKGIVSGMGDGRFAPNNNVTRAEFASMINNAFGFDTAKDISFKDVPDNAWFKSAIQVAVGAGYISGYSDNTVKPNNKITRAEAASIAYKVSGVDTADGASDKFNDTSSIPAWAKTAVDAVVAAKIFNGDQNNNFRASSNLTRAEAAVIITKLMNSSSNHNDSDNVVISGTTFGTPDGAPTVVTGDLTVMNAGTTVQNVVVNGDLIIDKNVGEGDVTLDNITVKGTTHVYGGGANSIHISNSSLATIVVAKANNNVRIEVSGTTTVVSVSFTSGGKLDNNGASVKEVVVAAGIPSSATVNISGNVEKVNLQAVANLNVTNGTIGTFTVAEAAKGATVKLEASVTVKIAEIHAVIVVTGKGTITSANITVSGVTMETAPVSSVDGSVAPVINNPTPSGGGGGGSSSGGGSTTQTNYTLTVSNLADLTFVVVQPKTGIEFTSVTVNTVAATKQADNSWRAVLDGTVVSPTISAVAK